jgi:hypothetical protein
MSKVIGPPQSGRVGNVVYRVTRTGLVASRYVVPRNPQLPKQQLGRATFGVVSGYWRVLSPEDQEAWCLGGADPYTMSRLNRTSPLPGYHYYARINNARAAIGLSRFNRPPAIPSFGLNTTGPLAITNTADVIALKLPVVSLPTQYVLVEGAAPCSAGIRYAKHYPFLGFLPEPVDGWSDITALYVDCYGVPPVGAAILIRTRQHIDGWTDQPIVTRAIVRPG